MAQYMKLTLNASGQRTATEGLTLNQNSYFNTLIVYTPENYEVISVFFRRPDGQISPQMHLISDGLAGAVDDVEGLDGYYTWHLLIPFSVTSFTMPNATARLDVSLAMYYHTDAGVQLSPRMANCQITVNRSSNTAVLDASYNATDVQNLWQVVGSNAGQISKLNKTAVLKSAIVTAWSDPTTNTRIPSEKLAKDSLDAKLDDSQLISDWANASATTIPNASLTKAALDAKLDDSQLVTAWSASPSASNIPSEKLAYDSIAEKINKSSIVTAWDASASSDEKVPSEKLVKTSLDAKLATADFSAATIVSTLGTTPVNRATADASGNEISSHFVAVTKLGAANGVATLDSNQKVPLSEIPDSVLGQLLYAGTIAADGSCTLSSAFKSKYGISALTIAQNISNAYEGSYFIASAAGTIASDGTLPAIKYETGDWIVSNGTSGYSKIDNTDAVQGVKGNAETDYRTGEVNLTPADIGSVALANIDSTWANASSNDHIPGEKLVYDTFVDHIGKMNQLDFTGTLSGDTITFELTTAADEITLIENNLYEIDLHFPAAGVLANASKMVISYGTAKTTINISNILNNSGTMLVGDMKQLEKYSADTGWRWIFQAVYNNVSGNHFFGIPSTVVRADVIAMSDGDLATHIADADLEKGQLVFISSESDANGFYLGHTYKVEGATITDVTALYMHLSADAATAAVALTPSNGVEYRYGTLTSLAITAPTDILNFHAVITFASGDTATTVTLPSTAKAVGMHINNSGSFLPRPNTQYILSLRNDGLGNLCVMVCAL